MKKTATRKTEPNEGLSHASQLVILHTRRLTTTLGPWQQTPPSDAATAGGAATTTMGSRDAYVSSTQVCFFFSHINLTNGYLNIRLHVRPKRWPSPPLRLV